MEKLNIAIIGCGGIASAHVNGFKDLYSRGLRIFDIKAVCGHVSKERPKEKAETIGGFQEKRPKIYMNFENMLKEENLDAVDICAPPNVHHSTASRCLEEGLHVIIEKPLGITMRTAKIIIDVAEKHKRTLAVAENYRRSPENRAVWWAIRQGFIEKPRVIIWTWATSIQGGRPYGWRADKLVAGGSETYAHGVHIADLDRYHLGMEALQVYSVTDTFEPVKEGVKVSVDDMAMAVIQYENRVYAQWLCTNAISGKNVHTRVIYGSKGSLMSEGFQVHHQFSTFTQKEGTIEKYNKEIIERKMMESLKPEEREKWFPKGSRDTFAIELYDFYDSVINNRRPEVDGWEAYKDIAIPLGLYESAALGKPVKIKDIEDLKIEEYQKEINENICISS